MASDNGRLFLLDALDLVSSYLATRAVELEEVPVGLRDGGSEPDETSQFLQELEARHAIACARRLREKVLPQVERQVSNTSELVDADSRGTIRGRLNVPRYLAERAQQRSLPRTYPILLRVDTSETPENALVVQVLRSLSAQLGRSPFPRTTAEGLAAAVHYDWLQARLRRLPWSELRRRDHLDTLVRETAHRIRKRQTGNEVGYGALLEWMPEWQVDVDRLGSHGSADVVEGLLAFPLSDFFQDKVFEIWCLQQIATSLSRLGCRMTEQPCPLHMRHKGPIFRFTTSAGTSVDVWFQRQEPLGKPRWRYEQKGGILSGIPDIVVTRSGGSPFVVDAKYRLMREDTRPEETYKMLGYLENFRDVLGDGRFRGLLVFTGSENKQTALTSIDGSRLSLLAIQAANRQDTRAVLDEVVSEWLTA